MCNVLLPPGVNTIAVNKYIKISKANLIIYRSAKTGGQAISDVILV